MSNVFGKSEAQRYLDAITREGRTITVNLTINDAEKAQAMMATLHGHNVEQFGVTVEGWGFYNTALAEERRKAAMIALTEKFNEQMAHLAALDDRDFLTAAELSGDEEPEVNHQQTTFTAPHAGIFTLNTERGYERLFLEKGVTVNGHPI